MNKLKVVTVLGTRPEIIRLSVIIKKFDHFFDHMLVHTGQNYDYTLNEIFFEELEIRKADFFLEVVGKDLGETMGNVLSKSYKLFSEIKPDALLVLGDTNSALCTISAKRLKIPIFHMEAGNRCFDQNVPEELNRKIADHTSDINLTYTENSRRYLLAEGFRKDHVFCVGSPLKEVLDFYSDQIAVIKNIAQSLPIEMKLFVKEHPSMWAVGWRDTDFYKQICKLPNVTLIHPSVPGELMIQKSSFVITIAGTAALEATFYEKPVIIFSDINCSTLSSVFKINDLKDLPKIIKKCLNSKVDLIELNHFFHQVEKSTFICDVENLFVESSNFFGMGGMLNMNKISESDMIWFLKEYENDFDILATEHIRQMKFPKNK